MVHVRYWHTGVKKNASGGGNASYRQWSGTDGKDWLPVKRLLLQIDKLTGKKKMIAANYRRRIENILATTATVNDDDEDDHDDDGEGDD